MHTAATPLCCGIFVVVVVVAVNRIGSAANATVVVVVVLFVVMMRSLARNAGDRSDRCDLGDVDFERVALQRVESLLRLFQRQRLDKRQH